MKKIRPAFQPNYESKVEDESVFAPFGQPFRFNPPNYDFMGPGNPLPPNRPKVFRNMADKISYEHDVCYGQHKGHPYINCNTCDSIFIDQASRTSDFGAFLGSAYFRAKRAVLGCNEVERNQNKVLQQKRLKTNTIWPLDEMAAKRFKSKSGRRYRRRKKRYGSKRRRKYPKLRRRRYKKRTFSRRRGYRGLLAKYRSQGLSVSVPMFYKEQMTGQITAESGRVSYYAMQYGSSTNFLGLLGKFNSLQDPGGTGNFAEADMTIGSSEIRMMAATSITGYLRNNATTMCNLTFYYLQPKRILPAGTTVVNHIEEGIRDLTNNTVLDAYDAMMYYPHHSPDFRKFYKVYRTRKVLLEPGSQTMVYARKKMRMVLSEEAVDHAWGLHPKYSPLILIRLEGLVGHAKIATTDVGTMKAQVDWVCNSHVTYRKIGDMMVSKGYNNAPDLQVTDPVTHMMDVAEEPFNN